MGDTACSVIVVQVTTNFPIQGLGFEPQTSEVGVECVSNYTTEQIASELQRNQNLKQG